MMVIILQYTNLSNNNVAHLKLIQCYISIISQLKTENELKVLFYLFWKGLHLGLYVPLLPRWKG